MRAPIIVVHGGAGRRSEDVPAAEAGCRRAAEAGWAVLRRGGGALDAVLAAVVVMEDDPAFNAGVGSCLTAAGTVEMDASIMDGAGPTGAGVALLTSVRHPIRLAHAVMLDGRHALLAGPGAEAFARAAGLESAAPDTFITERQRARWRARIAGPDGTVGAVALDGAGHLAAATSTGGLAGKRPGRIGDSAVIGAGTYADDRAGAAAATGAGEAILQAGLARVAVDTLRAGRAPARVAPGLVRAAAGPHGAPVGLILLDRFGRIATAHCAEQMPTATRSAEDTPHGP